MDFIIKENNIRKINFLIVILIVSSIILLLPNISAEEYPPHKQRTNFTLTVSSNNASACNLSSIQYPDNTQRTFSIPLTKQGTNFYLTIDSSNYSLLGDICHSVSCTDGAQIRTGSACKKITPSGFQGTLGFYFLILLFSFGIIILGYWIEDAWVIILGSFGLVFVGLFVLFYGIDGFKDPVYTWGLGIISLMLAAYFMIMGSLEKMGE